jgi:hypothetical protein
MQTERTCLRQFQAGSYNRLRKQPKSLTRHRGIVANRGILISLQQKISLDYIGGYDKVLACLIDWNWK